MNILRANLVSRLTYAGLYCLRRNLNSLQISVLRGVNKSFVIFSRKFSIYRKPKRSSFTPGKLDSKLDSLVTAGPNLYVLHQSPDDVVFKSAAQCDVVDADVGVVRSEPLDATNALLDYHRVPRKVVVHQHVGNLKIDTFGACFGRYDYPIDRRFFSKTIDCFLIALARVAVDDSDFQPVTF